MTNSPLFLDTSGLHCLFDIGNSRYEKAAGLFRESRSLFTTNYVLAEFIPLTHARRLRRESALKFLETLTVLPRLQLIWIDETTHARAMYLLENRLDKTYSLCDAVSFVVMRERGIMDALTTDKHFEQEGFVRLLA